MDCFDRVLVLFFTLRLGYWLTIHVYTYTAHKYNLTTMWAGMTPLHLKLH